MGTEIGQGLGETPGMPWLATGPLWLLIVISIAMAAWWYWKRRGGGLPGARADLQIQILATRALGARNHLVIIETSGSRSLIATGSQGISFLRDLPMPAAGEGETGPRFDEHLQEGSPS